MVPPPVAYPFPEVSQPAAIDGPPEPQTLPVVMERSERRLAGLYLFAGKRRKGDMKEYLDKYAKEHDVKVKLIEYDTARSKRHDLNNLFLKKAVSRRVANGEFDFVLASPPCSTFSRARKLDGGPKPVRSTLHPRGFPWLSGPVKATVDQANQFVEFS